MKAGGDSRVFGMKKEHMKGQSREYTVCIKAATDERVPGIRQTGCCWGVREWRGSKKKIYRNSQEKKTVSLKPLPGSQYKAT